MKYGFAALRFTEDPNLKDRVYWYLSDLSLVLGERVLAPVGSHDRLQAARVEKLLTADEKDAPYDMRLIKRVAAKYGARKLLIGNTELLEFGGVRYDEKHYTPFGKLLLSKEPFCGNYGMKALDLSGAALYEEIARSTDCILLFGGEGERAFRALYAFLRGEGELPVSEETARLIKEKLR